MSRMFGARASAFGEPVQVVPLHGVSRMKSDVLVVSTYSFSQLPLKSPFSLLGMLAQTCVNCESVETLKTSIRFLSQQTASGS